MSVFELFEDYSQRHEKITLAGMWRSGPGLKFTYSQRIKLTLSRN